MKEDTELIILGTGNAMTVTCYNTCFAIRRGTEYFLVDAGGGNGIFRQLKGAEIPITKIHHIFLTHAHTDHILGMIWLIRKIASMMLAGKYEGICKIYCHEEAKQALLTICRLTLASKFVNCIGEKIVIENVQDKEKREILSMPVLGMSLFMNVKGSMHTAVIICFVRPFACMRTGKNLNLTKNITVQHSMRESLHRSLQ